ncbi:unnamed protein product [Caenorhabditis angaria]|uniref:Transmembrane protein n=1 Tax=Caenorhabditis angaria TaxID=860376 RepID=A0A9P1IQ17_9PELO|nr:unnamed protein product [Caenorhabditis angaria]
MKIIKNIIVVIFLIIIAELVNSKNTPIPQDPFEDQSNSTVSCPNIDHLKIDGNAKLKMESNCEYCVVSTFRENPGTEFLLKVECIVRNSTNSKYEQLIPGKCVDEYFKNKEGQETEYRATICRVDTFYALTNNDIWLAFFSGSENEWTSAIQRMNQKAQELENHEAHHVDYEDAFDVSITTWILLFTSHFIFFAITFLQYSLTNRGYIY